jgi:hypothetical protein
LKPKDGEERAIPAPPAGAGLENLGQLLSRGAELLSMFGRSLGGAEGPRGDAAAGWPRTQLQTDPQTGRRELRLTLPDDQTLQRWVGQVAEVIRSISARA